MKGGGNMLDMGSYTQEMYEDLINAAEEGYDAECDYSMLVEQINSPDFFEPFSERLRRYLSKRMQIEYSPDEAYQFLFNAMNEAGTNPTRNTIKNWLNVSGSSGGHFGPNMGDAGRESMFQVAFSLGLNASKTEDYFHRVYLDKAFNARNPKEFIYFYCLQREKSYTEAKDLATEAEKYLPSSSASSSGTATVMMKQVAKIAKDDEELLTYIREHAFNFTGKSKTAQDILDWLKRDLCGGNEQIGLAEQEYLAYKADDMTGSEGRNPHSVDFVLAMAEKGPLMIGESIRDPNAKKVRDILTRKEISNQFPNANTISHPDSSYIMRKNIILLYFYWYWVKDILKEYPEGDDESFVTELNSYLFKCGYSPLYYGNPYDWVFLYCSACKDNGISPLDVFRGILATDEEE